jgi:RND family efflux transporter MFP subunit
MTSKLGASARTFPLIVALIAGCGSSAPPPPAPTAVTAAAVIAREVAEWDEFTGRLRAIDTVEIRPRVSGYIQQVAFHDGATVKKNQLLFVIDPKPYQAELQRALAQLSAARSRATLAASSRVRADKLLAVRALSREEYDQRVSAESEASQAINVAAADVTVARLNLGYTSLRSPIDGRVSRAEVTAGNLVNGSGPQGATLLTTVVSMDPIYVEFEGDEQVYLKYTTMARNGDRPSSRDVPNPVYMGLADESGYPHAGRMVFVDNQLNTQTGTIRARAIFDNKQGAFTPGLFARLQLVGSGKFHALLITDKAVGTDQDRKFVLVVGKDNKLLYRNVTLGRSIDGLRLVTSGLAAGEIVVVNGLQRARAGDAVKAEIVPMDAGIHSDRGAGATLAAAPGTAAPAQ